ncbi:hypothetical protein LX32DRAFT_298940 [Colletotrichum zoysiae]|uniref:Uncharacterized protein n=1 Tax=Colletotrichum zoysiae TaxID=1216348 RepID=A0AAD9H1H1_9PEZI|nr:hypothetical protein LX32DRAFT_298940 [Colletotrichum zoysiae]
MNSIFPETANVAATFRLSSLLPFTKLLAGPPLKHGRACARASARLSPFHQAPATVSVHSWLIELLFSSFFFFFFFFFSCIMLQ